MCDGVQQCHDKSDESTCAVITNGCNATQFKCTNRKCIANAFVCDSKDDCGDASDEKYCGKYKRYIVATISWQCNVLSYVLLHASSKLVR